MTAVTTKTQKTIDKKIDDAKDALNDMLLVLDWGTVLNAKISEVTKGGFLQRNSDPPRDGYYCANDLAAISNVSLEQFLVDNKDRLTKTFVEQARKSIQYATEMTDQDAEREVQYREQTGLSAPQVAMLDKFDVWAAPQILSRFPYMIPIQGDEEVDGLVTRKQYETFAVQMIDQALADGLVDQKVHDYVKGEYLSRWDKAATVGLKFFTKEEGLKELAIEKAYEKTQN